jgi:putative membrane protein
MAHRDRGSSAAQRAGIAIVATAAAAAIMAWLLGAGAYMWVKALHVVAVISWLAGMLYLPRLFAYHAEAVTGSELSETFKVMEQRLLSVIMMPAMAITWVLGLWLAWQGGYWAAPWLHAKLALVVALSGLHGYLSAAARAFREDRNTKPASHWRLINEIPTLLMLAIVILVIVKPF